LGYAHFLFPAAVSFVVCVISFVYSLPNKWAPHLGYIHHF
jgi:hypothetical protein